MEPITGLNSSGGTNRLKFAKLDQRIAQARSRVDVVHKVKEPVEFLLGHDKAVEEGPSSEGVCLFREHLLKYIELNTSKAFQSLGKLLLPLSGSLPEVLHHLDKIVGLLTTHLGGPWASGHDTALLLISVLAKELGGEMYERHFDRLMSSLIASLDPANPEASSRVFQTMSYLFKHLGKRITAHMDTMKKFYGPLLGHPKQYLRRFAAESLSLLLRRLEERALTRHLRSVLKATAIALHKAGTLHHMQGGSCSGGSKRGKDLLDGLSLLLFYTIRGLESQGTLHSCGPPVLRWLVDQEMDNARPEKEKPGEDEKAEGAAERAAAIGLVHHRAAAGLLAYLCPHLKPMNTEPLWAELTRDLPRLAVTCTAVTPARKADTPAKGKKRKAGMAGDGGGQKKEEGEAGQLGFTRRLHLLAICIKYRRGWLLVHDSVRCAQCVTLSRLSRGLTEGRTYALLSRQGRRETVDLLLGLLEWQASRRARGNVGPEESGLRRALARALGVAFGPEHGLDETLMGDLAGKALAHFATLRAAAAAGAEKNAEKMARAGEEMDVSEDEEDGEEEEEGEESHMASLLSACLKRWLELSCPPSTRLGILRAILLSSPTPEASLRAVPRAQLRALGHKMVAMLHVATENGSENGAENGESSTALLNVLLSLRCLPDVLAALTSLPGQQQEEQALGTQAIEAAARWARLTTPDKEAPAKPDKAPPAGKRNRRSSSSDKDKTEQKGKPPAANGKASSAPSSLSTPLSRAVHGSGVLCYLRLHEACHVALSPSSGPQLLSTLLSALRAHPSSALHLKALHACLSLPQPQPLAPDPSTSAELLSLLTPNLSSRSHLTRLSTLRVLSCLPPLPYLPPSTLAARQADALHTHESPYRGPCPLLPLLLEIESLPISLSAERELTTRLTRLDVLARSSRLPSAYLQALGAHCLGLLHVKFAVLWPLAASAFGAVAEVACPRGAEEVEGLWAHVERQWAHLDGLLAEQYAVHDEAAALHSQAEPNADLHALKALLSPQAAPRSSGEENGPVFRGEEEEGEEGEGWEGVGFVLEESAEEMGPHSFRAAADATTALSNLFLVLKKAPALAVRRASALSSLFFTFLQLQYFALYPDDPEARELDLGAALKAEDTLLHGQAQHATLLPAKACRAKLVGFLDLFSYVSGARHSARLELLNRVFRAFLARPDGGIAKPALECVLVGKPPGVTPYAAHLRALLDDKALRDELVKFSLARDVQPEHRAHFMPVLVRVLFGRFLSKGIKAKRRSSKDAPAARRSAIVSFLAGAQEVAEFREFVHLMLRPFLQDATKPFSEAGNLGVRGVSIARRLGFLHLLRSVVRQMGFHVVAFVPSFIDLVLGLLDEAAALVEVEVEVEAEVEGDMEGEEEEEEEEEEEDGEEKTGEGASRDGPAGVVGVSRRGLASIKPLALRALTELVGQFSEAVSLTPYTTRLWTILGPSVSHLPSMCSSSPSPPSLLQLLVTLCQDCTVLPVYRAHASTLTPTLLACLSLAPKSPVASAIFEILERLLEQDGPGLLLPYLPDLVHHLSIRLSKAPSSDPLLERALGLLCHTGQLAARLSALPDAALLPDGHSLSSLFALLLPRLKTRAMREDVKALVLDAYATLACHLPNGSRDVMTLARLLGPAGLAVGMGPASNRERPLRSSLVAALDALAQRDDLLDLKPAMQLLQDLNAMDEENLEGRDLGRCMPVWARLSDDDAWAHLMTSCGSNGLALLPLLCHALASLHDEEVVIRVAAGGAVRAFIRTAAEGEEEAWKWVITAMLVPALRSGMAQQVDTVRQGYVMCLAELVRCGRLPCCWFTSHAAVLHLDLGALQRDDEPESDFFHNVTHIQVHRRTRALNRLRQALEAAEQAAEKAEKEKGPTTPGGASTTSAFASPTLVHILLPLACQPLLFRPQPLGGKPAKPLDPSLLHEALLTVGVLARQVSWSHYHALLRRFLRELSRCENEVSPREKALVSALCQVLDAFHFPMTPTLPPEAAVAAPVQEEQGDRDEEEEEEPEEEEEAAEAGGEAGDVASAFSASTDGPSAAAPPPGPRPNNVYRLMRTQMLPSLRNLLLKQVKDKHGGKVQVLRAPVALAILKIIRLLPPVDFDMQLTRLLMAVCVALRSRDSTAREGARGVYCQMLTDLGPDYLPTFLHQLCAALKEGYQLHVRLFTLHAMLRTLAEHYAPPADAPSFPVGPVAEKNAEPPEKPEVVMVRPALDSCIKDMLSLLLEDLFGELGAAKESEADVKSATIREAKGQKALDCLELLGRLILFRPTYAVAAPEGGDPGAVSSVHALVSPLLWQMHDSESPKIHAKVNQALQRVVNGLGTNPSLQAREVLLYVYGLISPFLLPSEGDEEEDGPQDEEDGSSDEEDEEDMDIAVNGYKPEPAGGKKKKRGKRRNLQWLPHESTLKLAIDPRLQARMDAAKELKVQDGRNAPKLTGHGRHQPLQKTGGGGMFGDPTALGAGVFGLRLLHSFLKRAGLSSASKPLPPAPSPSGGQEKENEAEGETRGEAFVALVDPYVALLTRCVRRRVNDGLVLLSLKCLGLLLRHAQGRLPSIRRYGRKLARRVLSLLTMAGGPANSRDELVQSCTKTLTLLLERDVALDPGEPQEHREEGEGEEEMMQGLVNGGKKGAGSRRGGGPRRHWSLPLSTPGFRSLVSLLSSAALDYDHHNATFALIRALVSRRVLVPEMYDLMDQLAGIAVTSRRVAVRTTSGQILVTFLLTYPLTPAKLSAFLTTLVRNLGYEYEEGRAAALECLEGVTAKLPTALLDEHAQAFFLPMTLRLVNDPSPKVRARAAQSLGVLLRRVSGDVFHLLLEYQVQWLQPQSPAGVARAAAQGVGLFVEARPDLVKRGDFGSSLLSLLTRVLSSVEKRGSGSSRTTGASDLENPRERESEEVHGWEVGYHVLLSVQAMYERLPGVVEGFWGTDKGREMLRHVSSLLVYRHAWVRLASSRLMGHYLDRRNPTALALRHADETADDATTAGETAIGEEFLCAPEVWFPLVRRLCVQLDRPSLAQELSQRAVKSLLFVALALAQTQTAKGATKGQEEEEEEEGEGGEEEEEEEGDEEEEEGGKGGKGPIPKNGLSWVMGRLAYMARRKGEDRRAAVFHFFAAFASVASVPLVLRYLPHMLTPLYRATTDGQGVVGGEEGEAPKSIDLAKEVLELIEGRVGSGPFVQAYADIQKGAAKRREARKKARAVEAITDPGAAAKRRVERNLQKRESKKRKAAEQRRKRGVFGKRTRFDDPLDVDDGM